MKRLFALFAPLLLFTFVGCEKQSEDGDNPTKQPNVECEECKIYYTTTDNKRLFPTDTEPALFGAMLISNTYENGQGVLLFDGCVTEIGKSAFEGCARLETITIPSSVVKIGSSALYECPSLTSVYCKATTPPEMFSIFGGGNQYRCKLYVPTESEEAYKAHSDWKFYAEYIVGYDF